LILAQNLGCRSGTAIENARLYSEAQNAISTRDLTIAVISHDLRNPVSTLSLCIGMLRNHILDPAAEKSLHIMKKATDQMDRLIQNLLDLSVVEAGHVLPVAPKPIRPAELISEICKSMETQVGEKSLSLKYHVSPVLPEVFADPDQIARA